MHPSKRQSAFLCSLLCFGLSACSFGGAKKSTIDSGAVLNVHGAVQGIESAGSLASNTKEPFTRPSASLGLFATLYIAELGFAPVFSAANGIDAQMKLHTTESVTEDNSFALLQEFGSVLSVNVPDMLNRSTDRAGTLNDYLQGLANITVRSATKAQDIKTELDTIEGNRRTAQSAVTASQRIVNQALRDKDYATAAAEQEKLAAAQSDFAKIDTQRKLTQDVLATYKQLLTLADKRQKSIDLNRAILLSGLSVVQIPGIEDLNILQKGTTNGTSTNSFGL